jgi:hypothetical protein
LDFPFASDDQKKINEIWNSANNQRVNSERFTEFYSWIDKLGLR